MGARLHLDGRFLAICMVLQRQLTSTFFIASQQPGLGGGAPGFTYGKHCCKFDSDSGHVCDSPIWFCSTKVRNATTNTARKLKLREVTDLHMTDFGLKFARGKK